MSELRGKKVLYVITKSNWGGAQSYVYTLATQAKKNDAEVAVALGGTGEKNAAAGALAQRLSEEGVRVIFLNSFARDISIFREFAALGELWRIIRAERPDVLHLNSSKASGIGALAGRLCGVKHIIFTAHGWPHKEPRPLLFRVLIWLASYATVLLAHTIIVLSPSQFKDAPSLFLRRKLIVIPNGVSEFPLLEREKARTKLAEFDDRIRAFSRLILCTSELHFNKGLDILIDAFVPLAATHPDTALVLIHSGEERERLMTQTERLKLTERIFFLGFVPDARSLLSAADMFVLPSRKEGLPFGLLEAGRASRAVIATTVGGIPEVIDNNITGLLIPPENAPLLTAAMTLLLDQQATSHELGRALQKRIVEHYSETYMVQETFALYKQGELTA